MSEPFLAEIKIFAFNFPPRGWAQCDGQTLPINQNQSLYSLLGTIYGGDGETIFALPDLRARQPVHEGAGFSLGQRSGEASVELTEAQLPAHTHTMRSSDAGTNMNFGTGLAPAADAVSGSAAYGPTPDTTMSPNSISQVGDGVPHENRAPYLAVNFCIAVQGLFPSRT